MCIGIPMRIERRSGDFAECRASDGLHRIDLALLPEARAGDHVLAFLGTGRRLLDAEEARLIGEAVAAMMAVMAGSADPACLSGAFADLDREPQLPPHLAAAHAAGRKEA